MSGLSKISLGEKKVTLKKKSFHDILHCKRRCLYQKYNVNDLCNCFCYFRHAHIHGQEVRKQSMTFQTMVKILLKYYFKGFFCFLDRCFFTLGQKSSIYPKIHILKISFFTKFTISKSHFSQNSHFVNLIFQT